MATDHSRSAARLMMTPAVILLLGWMLVPLTMTLYFSFKKYLPMRGDSRSRARLGGVRQLCPLHPVLCVLAQCPGHPCDRGRRAGDHRGSWRSSGDPARSAILGAGCCAHPCDRTVFRDADRLCAGVEEHVHGSHERRVRPSVAVLRGRSGGVAVRGAAVPSIVMIVSWQWLPFATLILLTAIQSLDSDRWRPPNGRRRASATLLQHHPAASW
jgi:sorbitol/mannitol transport system permease protein